MNPCRLMILFTVLLSATATAFAQGAAPDEAQAFIRSAADRLREFKIYAADLRVPAVSGSIQYADGRFDVPRNQVELLNLPAGWQKIEVLGENQAIVSVWERERPATASLQAGERNFWFLRHPALSLLFLLMGFYAVFAIGLSGGPNHGEHPFLLNAGHLAGFLFLTRTWNPNAYYAYLLILILALALSIYAVRLRIWDQPIQTRIFKGLMIACYLGLFLILNIKTYQSAAVWTSTGSVQFYVPKTDRGRMQVLGGNEKVLAEFQLTGGVDCRSILLWDEKEEPKALKILSPQGKTYLLQPGQRPSG